MKRDFLKNLGLEDEVIDKILDENGRDIRAAKTAGKEDAKNDYADYDDLKNQLFEANKQIQDFKDMDIDGIKTAAADWEKKAKDLKFNYAIEGALRDSKAKDTKSVMAHIDRDALEFDEESGSINGLDQQIESIRGKYEYLFESEAGSVPKFTDSVKGGAPVTGTLTKEEFTKMPYLKKLELKRSNPEQYKQLNE